MTRRYFITGVVALVLAGCGGGEKSADAPPSDLYGTWKLTRIRGGVGGVDMAPDYQETILFRTNGTASIQRNDAPPVDGAFQSKRQVTDLQSQPLLVLTLPNGIKRAILTKSLTSLTLSEFNISDRQMFDYTRQTN